MKLLLILVAISAVGFSATADDEDRLYADAVANAKTEKQRTTAIYEQRIHEYARKNATFADVFRPGDGIDQFEALILSRSYASRCISGCIDIDLPELVRSKWVVHVLSIGRKGEPGPDIIIDAKSGAVHCDGHPDIVDSLAFLNELDKPRTKKPNQSPKPTPGAVH